MPKTSFLGLVCLALVVVAACADVLLSRTPDSPSALPQGVRALWVTRFDYKTREDVVRAIDNARSAGFDTVLFQVRGNATAFYRSSLEPWAEELGGRDPGFDPLAVAIEAARERGLRLHAWVNVMPAWWGLEPPKDPGQLYHRHTEWLWYDQNGAQQALSDKFYVSVNPCLPEVRRYLVDVLRDLVGRYPVDGLHLDYLRFPNEPPGTPSGSKLDYPRDKQTLTLFRGETGKTPEQDPKAWNAWRTEQVTSLLRDVRKMVRETRAKVELSSAVGPEPEKALHHFQDVRAWLAEDLVDAVYPMNYTGDMALFRARVESWRALAAGRSVVLGLRVDDDADRMRVQIETALQHFDGFALFAYSTLFDSPNTAIDDQDAAARSARAERRKVVLPLIQPGRERAARD